MIVRTSTHSVNLYTGTVDVREDSAGWGDPTVVFPCTPEGPPCNLGPESTDAGLKRWRRYRVAERI